MAYASNTATNAGLIEIQIQYRAVPDLLLDARNPRQHSQRQVNQLADSIREFGFVMPVVADDSGHVVIGHGRVLAAKKLGMPRIPVVEIKHLSQAQLKALRIADNKLAQNAHWDERLLGESLLELKELDRDFDLSITGFSLPEIDLAIQKLSEEPVEDIDDSTSVTGVPVCQVGDIWELDGHRVHCGDAKSEAAFDKLMQDGRGVVVDYDYVKRLMFTKTLRDDDNTEEGRASHRERTKSAIKTARTRLMALDVVGCLDAFIWWSGRPVRGIRETQKHAPSLFDWPETAAAPAAAFEDVNRLCADVQTLAAL